MSFEWVLGVHILAILIQRDTNFCLVEQAAMHACYLCNFFFFFCEEYYYTFDFVCVRVMVWRRQIEQLELLARSVRRGRRRFSDGRIPRGPVKRIPIMQLSVGPATVTCIRTWRAAERGHLSGTSRGKWAAVTGRSGAGCKSIRIEGRRRRRCCVGYAPARGGEEEREEKRMGRVAVVWSASPSPSPSSPSPIVLCAAASSRSLPRRAGVVRTARFRPQSCRARPVAMSSAAAAGSSSPSPCPPVDLAEAGEAGGHEERCASKSASDAIFGGIPAGLLPEILSEALVWSSLHGLVVGDRNAPVSGYSLPCWNRWKWGSRLLEVRFDDDPWFVVETVPPRKLTTRIFPFSSCQLLLGFFFLKLLADSCRGIISFPANLGVLAYPLFQEKKRRLRLIV